MNRLVRLLLEVATFTAVYTLAKALFGMNQHALQAAWLSWQWLTTWPLDKTLGWSAAALTIYGAWLLANPAHRWTSWGFVFFLGANALWIYYAWLTGQGSLFVQQLVLTVISLQGIRNQLVRPTLQAFNQLFEEPKL